MLINWNGQDGETFAKETREMTAYKIAGSTLIEFNSRLESAGADIKLDGDPQHAGFQFRASQLVPDKTKKETYYLRPDGKGEPGKFRNWSPKKDESEINRAHINLPWNTLVFQLPALPSASVTEKPSSNETFSCVYLDRPNNPKPARFSERDYGRFGSYFEYSLTPSKPLTLNYRIWLQEGELSLDAANSMSHQFNSPAKASKK